MARAAVSGGRPFIDRVPAQAEWVGVRPAARERPHRHLSCRRQGQTYIDDDITTFGEGVSAASAPG